MKRISLPIESLMSNKGANSTLLETDFLIIGSGYGGAVAAMRLASGGSDGDLEPKRDVVVLERGNEYSLGDFPYNIEDLPSHVRVLSQGHAPRGYADALFHIHAGSEDLTANTGGKDDQRGKSIADVLVGSGLGGTSLINANVAEKPLPHVFLKAAWPKEIRDTPDLLETAFDEVKEHIGVTEHVSNGGQTFPKYAALQRFGQAIGTDYETRPASIAVTDTTKTNGVGVKQAPCTDCGNCVTGCNVGAKNSLDRNLLRLAKTRGARFFTGATVIKIEPNITQPPDTAGLNEEGTNAEESRWKIVLHPTVQPAGTVGNEAYFILAKNVILAAGSLGSTEILLRSRAKAKLDLSEALGKRFSTNGDGLIMSYAQTRAVGSIAEPAQKNPTKKIGPTITGIIRTKGLSIEEASVPASLGRAFSELVTTSAMLQRMVDRKLPPLLRDSGRDPLAASMEVADHCQAFLVQGEDGADGELSLPHPDCALKIAFPNSSIADNAALVRANQLVQSQDRKDGLDGGQFAPNPLWQLAPKEASQALGGKMPAGRALTVHPLGGCAMADTAASGVVNHAGQVFKRDGSLHDGLYVMDGSIIPVSLEVNPFLTIAALAWRNAGLILKGAAESGIPKVSPEYAELGTVPERQRDRPHPTAFVIQEQLTGSIDELTPWFKNNLTAADQQRLIQQDGLVVQVSACNAAGENWLNNPGNSPLNASIQLYVNPLPLPQVQQFKPVGVAPAHLQKLQPFLELEGDFTILREDKYDDEKEFWSGICAIWTYIARRGWGSLQLTGGEGSLPEKVKASLNGIAIFHNIGVLQSRFRRLSYSFRNEATGIRVHGDKVMGYRQELERMWPALLNLTLNIEEKNAKSTKANLTVNAEYLLEPGLLQVKKSANLPQSLLFAGGLAAYFARSMFATNFWEFAALEYPTSVPDRPFPPPLKTQYGKIKPATEKLYVPTREATPPEDGETIPLLLTRYRREGAKPILLLHGLAQGSQIFWTQGAESMAAYFYDNGFDVWLLDYRLSTLVLPGLPKWEWSMDEIAMFDIPMAIDAVRQKTGYAKISVFGHCVGACTLAMAALSVDGLGNKIEAAVTNAIHPWVIGAPANRFRSKFGSFFREWVPQHLLDPIPVKNEASALQNVIDRLAYGLARINAQVGDNHQQCRRDAVADGVCDRMTFLYGRMWNHKQLSRETHKAFVEMLGPAPLGVYQHLYYYNQVRRLTDQHGENAYLERGNIVSNWKFPILFVHGADSRVFNPHSARRSALRLRTILEKASPGSAPAVRYAIFKDCGHMDVVFGKNAHKNCFPKYKSFLENPEAFRFIPDDMDWPEPNEARPATGPVLRAAWIENNNICLRIWSELRTHVTDIPAQIITDGGREVVEFEAQPLDPSPTSRPRFRFFDIETDGLKPRIELVVRGEIPDHQNYRGAELSYEQQSWLLRLRAGPVPAQPKSMRFLVGSSRYPGAIVDNALSDQIYVAMREHTTSETGAHLLFFIGDQIYADAVDQLFDIKSVNSKFTERYRRAFGSLCSPHFAALVSEIPTHFALDDHEIGDNWSGLPPEAPIEDVLYAEFAIATAARFMSSGRDQRPILKRDFATRFYYPLSHPQECDFPTFVADTRTERKFRQSNHADRYDLFNSEQYDALTRWLLLARAHDPDSPKFIFSGSIIAPVPTSYCSEKSTWRQQDGWAGYPKTLESLLLFIVEHQISKVVFVGGDAHLSSVSTLELEHTATGRKAIVRQIVSSGLYAPMPFANAHAEDYNWSDAHTLPTQLPTHLAEKYLQITCKNTLLSDHYYQFVRVDATEKQVTVTCMDENNKQLAQKTLYL